MNKNYGPTLPISEEIHKMKYRGTNETFKEAMARVAESLKDDDEHFSLFKYCLYNQRFLPAGRVQSSMGAPRRTTPYNCFVSGTIKDSMEGIAQASGEAARTMQLGGGIGYDFSTLRPRGALIRSLESRSSGPVSFMGVFDAWCKTIASAGHRRGAQMGVLRVDHPDIEEFIGAKNNETELTQFNISVGVTDAFMEAVKVDGDFDLVFEGQVYKTISAKALWDEILRGVWDWAEPGVLFIDRINRKNNLHYCETIAATNPCLSPETLIETVDGQVMIKDITEPTMVYTMKEDGSLGIEKATASWVSKKNAETLKITVNSGKSVICTPDHLIYVEGNGWTEAQDLQFGDRLVHLCRARRGAAYSGVKLTTEHNRAYRMEHRMIAEAVYGEIPEGYDVHHLDENSYNNVADNLEIMCHKKHSTHTRHSCDNDHMVTGYHDDGKYGFISGPDSKGGAKDIKEMPEHLKSSLKNQNSACVSSITAGPVTDVYDMTVENTHNFIANFLVVHNCGEQPLPPYGACLLGSFNLVKYIVDGKFDYALLETDIPNVVRAMDNIIDRAIYPLPQQEKEAKDKRRMGLGVTGVANALEALGKPFGSPAFNRALAKVMKTIRDGCYRASVELAKEKGAFPLYEEAYLDSEFAKTLPKDIREDIKKYGIRNSHLLSVAPTGTISLSADNVSSGIEPVFSYFYDRTIQTFDGPRLERVEDYGYRVFGTEGITADNLSVFDHVEVLCIASKYVDSACSKTCNVGDDVTWEEFKEVYMKAYEGGASGCTTFRASGKRYGILNASASEDVVSEKAVEEDNFVDESGACYYDPSTGLRTCE